jgi:hypothetical protein
MNNTVKNSVNKVVKKETTKRTSNEIVTKGVNLLSSAKKNTKKEPKVKIKKVSFHSSLLNVNRLDKQENFSLSGALNRFKKQIPNDEQYKNIDSNVISKGLEFNTILEYVNKKCIEKQRFTVYSVGLAFNKFLKVTLK